MSYNLAMPLSCRGPRVPQPAGIGAYFPKPQKPRSDYIKKFGPTQKVLDSNAKGHAAGYLGESLAQMLYPAAKMRPPSDAYSDGGADFALPGNAFLEAKASPIGHWVKVYPRQRAHLAKRGSRLVVTVYNRHVAAVAGDENPATWIQPISQAIMFVLDINGPWFVELLRVAGEGPEDGERRILTNRLVAEMARMKVCPLVVGQRQWYTKTQETGGTRKRVRRDALIVFTLGKSQYQQLESGRAVHEKKMGRGEAAPF